MLFRINGALDSAKMFSRLRRLLQQNPIFISYNVICDMRRWEAVIPDSDIEAHFAWTGEFIRSGQAPAPSALRMAFLTTPLAGADGVVSRIAVLGRAKAFTAASPADAWNYVFPNSSMPRSVERFLR